MTPEKCCPKCGGTQGYEYSLVVEHVMNEEWGNEASCGDSEHSLQSLVRCIDCGARFQFEALKRKGLVA